MQIFELYFNPKKENCIAETFHHKPKDVYQSKIGRIYLLGEIIAPERKDGPLLQNLFLTLKENFYKDPSIPPEKALQSTLLEINTFIQQQQKKENLNVAIIASKNFSIFASKIGNIKIFLISKGKIINIGKEVEDGEFNFFGSIIVEKMKKNDKLIVLSSEIYSFFVKNNILQKIANETLSEDIAKKISALHKKHFPDIFGVAIIIDHTPSIKEDGEKTVSEKEKEHFSFKKIVKKSFPLLFSKKKKKKKRKKDKEEVKAKPKPQLNLKKLANSKKTIISQKKAVLLILSLILIVGVGSIILGIERSLKSREQTEETVLIKEKITSVLEGEDFSKMIEVSEEVELIKTNSSIFTKEVESLYGKLKERLLALSLSKKIEELTLTATIEEINPEKIGLLNNNLYLTSSKENSLIVYNIINNTKKINELKIDGGVNLSSPSSNGMLFFSPPSSLIRGQNNIFSVDKINLPSENSNFISLSSFLGRPYFLDNRGEIFTYTSNNPTKWIDEDNKRAEGGLSIAIDGSVYVLTDNSQILHYYRGSKEKIINISVFPKLQNPDKIITTAESPLIILDSKNERIIIIDKEGNLVEQLFHQKIEDAKDITISSNGKKIYLLIGKEVYSLEI